MIELYEHQKEGKRRLLQYKKYCLFFEIGTGKTFTALSAITELPKCKVLIVAPKRVLDSVWKKDNNYDLSNYDVTYINYEKVARDKTFYKNTFDVIVLDEVHKLKGKSTKTGKKFRVLTSKADYVWGLTGTPMTNNYAEIYTIFKNMNIKEFDMTYDEFVYTYYYTKSLKSSSGFNFEILLNPKPFLLDGLIERISKHSMTKEAKDCIDLPNETIKIIPILGMVNDKYKEIAEGILKTDTYTKTMLLLETLNKAHQAANGFFYDYYKNVVKINENKKLSKLNDLLEDIFEETEKVIIVYYFKRDLEELKSLNYSYTCDSNEFPNKQILFLHYNQSEGLNLQYCNQMIFYTYDYSFLNFTQMCGRIYRNGQKNKVTYYVLICKKTIEEKIWWAIKNKKSRNEYLKEVLGERNE